MFGVHRNYWMEDYYECWAFLGYVQTREAGEAVVANLIAKAAEKRRNFDAETARVQNLYDAIKAWELENPAPPLYDRRNPVAGTPPKPIRTATTGHVPNETKEQKKQIKEHNRRIENANRIMFEEWNAIVDAANEIANQPNVAWMTQHDAIAKSLAFGFGFTEYPHWYPRDSDLDDADTKYDIRPLKELKVE